MWNYLASRSSCNSWNPITVTLTWVVITYIHDTISPPSDGALLIFSQAGADLVQVCGECLIHVFLGHGFPFFHSDGMVVWEEALPVHQFMDYVASAHL